MTYDSGFPVGRLKPLISTSYQYYSTSITIKHWQLRDLVVVHSKRPSDIIFPNGRYINSLNMSNGQEKHIAEFDFDPRCLQVSEEGLVAAGGVKETGHNASLNASQGRFSFYNPATGGQITRYLGDLINNAVVFQRSGNSAHTDRVFVCNNDCSLYCMGITDYDLVPFVPLHFESPLNHAAISPDGQMIVACGDSPQIHVCASDSRYNSWKPIASIKTPGDYGFSVDFHESGVIFGVAFQNGECTLYDVRNLSKPLHTLKSSRHGKPLGAFRCLKFSQGSEDLLFLSEQMEKVHVVDTRDFENHQVVSVPFAFKEGVPAPRGSDQDQDHDHDHDHEQFQEQDKDQKAEQDQDPGNINGDENHSCDMSDANESIGSLPADHIQRQLSSKQSSIIQPFEVASGMVASDRLYSHDYFSVAAESDMNMLRLFGDLSAARRLDDERPLSIRANYGQSEFGISGLAWSDYDGGRLVVGTDNGIGVWNVDGWARRTFPTFTLR